MVFPPYFRASALNIDTLTKFYMLFLVTVFDQDLRLFCLSISRDFNTRMFFFFSLQCVVAALALDVCWISWLNYWNV